MKGKYRRAIASLVSAVILLISVTYAWILSSGITEGRFVTVDFSGTGTANYLNVVSAELRVEYYYQDASGNFVLKENDGTPLVIDSMVPNDMIPFKIRFYNNTGAEQTISLSVSGVQTSVTALNEETGKNKMLESVFVGISAGTGYTDTINAEIVSPDSVFVCLSDAAQRSGSDVYDLRLSSNIVIPRLTSSGAYVELNGFFWLDREAEYADVGNATLTISNFRILI